MHIKEFLENSPAPIEPGYVFTLLSEKTAPIYHNYVKKAADSLGLVCESFLDFKHPGDALRDILARIQKAEILVCDISDFTPNVMWELGVGLAIKDAERVIVIREKSDESLPFNIYSHRVSFQYDPKNEESLNELHKTLREVMQKINKANSRKAPIQSPEVKSLLDNALKAVERKEWITAEALFQTMDDRETNNWYIHNQWGIMHRSKGAFEAAAPKFAQALKYTEFDDEKAFIYTEIAVLHQMNRRYAEAEEWFKKAEKMDRENNRLYISWAEYYDELGDYFNAQTKIGGALAKIKCKEDPNYKELMLRHGYYDAKIRGHSYKKTFEQFKRERQRPVPSTGRNAVVEERLKGGGRLDGKAVTSQMRKSRKNSKSKGAKFEGSIVSEKPTRKDLTDEVDFIEPQSVLLGASAPRAVRPGDSFAVRFAAYVKEYERSVKSKLTQLSPDSETYLALREAHWRFGTKVKVQLYSPHLLISSSEEQFTWQGTKEIIDFRVQAPSDILVQKTILYVNILIGNISVADFVLGLSITSHISEEEPMLISKPPASTGFASYSSKDRQRVLDRTTEIRRSGLDLWMDCLDLRPGEKWKPEIQTQIKRRDLFLLFWSANAEKSKWVRWEVRTAKKEKGIYRIEPHPLDDTKPPPGLDELHFGDPYMLIRKAYEVGIKT